MALINLLTSPDPTNHKIAAEMPFSNAEWVEALKDIIRMIEDESHTGVIHFSKTFKGLNDCWYIQDTIVSNSFNWSHDYKLSKLLVYNNEIICLLRDNDSRIRYLGKENIQKTIKKLKHAIRNS